MPTLVKWMVISSWPYSTCALMEEKQIVRITQISKGIFDWYNTDDMIK